MITPMTSFLILEVHPFKIITILVLVPTWAMFQPVFKLALEEEFPIAVKFAIAVEHGILPLTFILEGFIEDKNPEART